MATAHNDAPFIVDELGESKATDLAAACYGLLNGAGRRRLDGERHVNAKQLFRVAVLFSGEVGVREHLRQAGIGAKTGQAVRLPTIPLPDSGMFQEHHGLADGQHFADALNRETKRYYGALGKAWVRCLARDPDLHARKLARRSEELLQEFRAEAPEGIPPEVVGRVADSFALIAAVGERAIKLGLLDWERGAVAEAAKVCFQAWASQET
jgi:putative DNA primase/helicase